MCPAHLSLLCSLKFRTVSGGAGECVRECVGVQTATSFLCDFGQVSLFSNLAFEKERNDTQYLVVVKMKWDKTPEALTSVWNAVSRQHISCP